MKKKAPELHVRLLDEDYAALSDKAAREGISMAEASRRIFHNALTVDSAERGLDVVTKTLRKTLAELDGKFKELKDLEYKILSTSATTQFLELRALRYIMRDLNESEFKEIYEGARRDSFNYVYRNGKIFDVNSEFMDTSDESASNSETTDTDYASLLDGGFRVDA